MSESAKCLDITSSVPWKSTIIPVVSSNSDYRTASSPPPNVVQRALVSAQTALQGPAEPRGPWGLLLSQVLAMIEAKPSSVNDHLFRIIIFLVPPHLQNLWTFRRLWADIPGDTVFSSLPIIDLFTAEVVLPRQTEKEIQGVEEMRKRTKKNYHFS